MLAFIPKETFRKIPVALFCGFLLVIFYIQFRYDVIPGYASLLAPLYFLFSVYVNIAIHSVVKGKNYFAAFDLLSFIKQNIRFHKELYHQAKVAVAEEFVWRFLPVMLIRYCLGLEYGLAIFLLITAGFIVQHFYGASTVFLILLIEFALYFALVSVLYYFWSDFLMIIIFHLVRNQTIFLVRKGYITEASGSTG